jgi:hypothetical protein
MRHGEFSSAADFAGYVAASPMLDGSKQYPAGRPSPVALFLRLREVLTTIEAGFYERARSLLLQVEAKLQVSSRSNVTTLLRANAQLLWGRLLQLQHLPRESLRKLDDAEQLFSLLKTGVPQGLDLLRCRSLIDARPAQARALLAQSIRPDRQNEHLFGSIASHYWWYLKARLSQLDERWDESLQFFESATTELNADAHHDKPDQLRSGYTLLGRGQSLAWRGHTVAQHRSGVEVGLGLLLTARILFRDRRFVPGEYIAHRQYVRVKADIDRLELPTHLPKEAHRLALRTGVLAFRLESAVDYADALIRDGRLNRAKTLLDEVARTVEASSSEDLKLTPSWSSLQKLHRKTDDAAVNCVAPTARWGLSRYADEELAFVSRCKDESSGLVVVYGPRGAGRRLLIGRIAEARGQTPSPFVLDGSRPDVQDVLDRVARERLSVVLSNFDQWRIPLQELALHRLEGAADWARRTYVTLSVPLTSSDIGQCVSSNVSEILYRGEFFRIQPLDSRPEDVLLLARGLVVQGLARRGTLTMDPHRLVLTGDACRLVKGEFSQVGPMVRVLRVLAKGLDVERDLIDAGDGRLLLSSEVLRRYLPPSTADATKSASLSRRATQTPPRADIAWPRRGEALAADETMIRNLAAWSGGRFAVVSRETGVARTSLRLAWTKNGRWDMWLDARSASRPGRALAAPV